MPGDSIYVFGTGPAGVSQSYIADSDVVSEAASAGATQRSLAVCLAPVAGIAGPPMMTVEIRFPSAPGANEKIEIQEADTDADGLYITPSNAAYTVTIFTNNIARVDLSPTGGKFLSILRTKGANAVGAIVKVTRLA